MKLYTIVAGALLLTVQFLSAQSQEGASFNFEFNTGGGKWSPYEHIISEYYKAYPFLTDTGNIAQKKKGISFSCAIVDDRFIGGFRIGGFRSTAWADGAAPTGGQWCEVILVKCQYTEAYAGFFFIRSTWFRMGINGGLALNVVKMKSQRSDALFPKAKEGKYIFLNPGNATNRENKMFCSIKLGLPIAIGRKFTICVEPFASLPLWKVNASEMRDEMIPNSTPAADKSYYKGPMPYGGVRFAVCIGGIKP